MWDDVPNQLSDIPPPPIPCQMKWPREDVRWSTQISYQIYPPSADIEVSRLEISHCYWHLVVKNGNFTQLLTSSGQEWQFDIATNIKWSRMAINRDTPRSAGKSMTQMHHGIYIIGSIWQPFWILQEKLGICFFFWIIRFINIQLALYNYVRCNPIDTPNTPKTPPHDNYKFQLWGIIWGGNFLLFLNN